MPKNESIALRTHFKSKIFIFCPSHSHTPTLSIVIEGRYTSSRDNWIASSAVPLLGKQRDNPNLSGERAKKAWQHAARPAQRLPCRAQRREGLPVWNLQGEKNAKPIQQQIMTWRRSLSRHCCAAILVPFVHFWNRNDCSILVLRTRETPRPASQS